MNHYINLLEPSEIHYLSSASTNPLYKIGPAVAAVLLLLFFGNNYLNLKKTIQEGQEIEATWNNIKEDVNKATQLNDKKDRFEEGLKTLKGWSSSRHQWPEVMDYIVEQSPVPPEDLQLTRLSFDEKMIGLRDQRPGPKKTKTFPLKRSVTITMRGILRSPAAGRVLPQYINKIQSGEDQPSKIAVANLGAYSTIRNEEEEGLEVAEFTFSIKLEDRELIP